MPLTPDEKIAAVEHAIYRCEIGELSTLLCPYCQVENQQGSPLCCNLFAAAAIAVMERRDLKERAELADRIANKIIVN